jgi:hypothetical protein
MDESISLSPAPRAKASLLGPSFRAGGAGSYLRASSYQRCALEARAEVLKGGEYRYDASRVRGDAQRSLIRVLSLEHVQACRRAPARASVNRVTSAQHSRSRKVDNRRIS